MIKVCSVMRATSKRLCFIASMALSNSTLSGCFVPTLANGLTDFLLVQPTVSASKMASAAINENRRDIKTSNQSCPLKIRLSTAPLPLPPSAAPRHSSLDHHYRTRRCLPPVFLRPHEPRRPPCRAPRHHPLRCGKSAGVGCESQLIAAFCAG